MLKGLISRFLPGRKPGLALTSEEMLDVELSRHPSERDLSSLMPIVVPLECLCPEWPGPIEQIGDMPFALAWATTRTHEGSTLLTYLNHEQAEYWENEGLDWRAESLRNLARISEGRRRWSREKRDEDGRPFILIMLHDDGLGPSRLLLPGLLEDVFGEDYAVAIPEPTCAIAYRPNLTPDQLADVEGMIGGCFRHGTNPLTPSRFDPRSFWVLN